MPFPKRLSARFDLLLQGILYALLLCCYLGYATDQGFIILILILQIPLAIVQLSSGFLWLLSRRSTMHGWYLAFALSYLCGLFIAADAFNLRLLNQIETLTLPFVCFIPLMIGGTYLYLSYQYHQKEESGLIAKKKESITELLDDDLLTS